jgi:endonuclease YncB( thermonuclease family)
MRGLSYIALALACGAAAGAPAPKPALTWASWVGDWDGKLKWSSCTIDGEPTATLAVEAVDGAMAIDLTPAGGALGLMTLAEDNDGWVGQKGDVTVHLDHTATGLDVRVELQSGCAMRASLKRASIGIASCDDLDAWARIESHCTKLARPRLENEARLVRQRSEWAKARGDARTKLAAQCTARSAKVAAELVDAGCAPDPDPPVATRGPECASLVRVAAKLSRCGTVPFDIATGLVHDANQLASAVHGADTEASLRILEKQCGRLREQIVSTAQQSGCPQ